VAGAILVVSVGMIYYISKVRKCCLNLNSWYGAKCKMFWPSGLRRDVKAVVFLRGGSNTPDIILFFSTTKLLIVYLLHIIVYPAVQKNVNHGRTTVNIPYSASEVIPSEPILLCHMSARCPTFSSQIPLPLDSNDACQRGSISFNNQQ
jgi:hypothetical protein